MDDSPGRSIRILLASIALIASVTGPLAAQTPSANVARGAVLVSQRQQWERRALQSNPFGVASANSRYAEPRTDGSRVIESWQFTPLPSDDGDSFAEPEPIPTPRPDPVPGRAPGRPAPGEPRLSPHAAPDPWGQGVGFGEAEAFGAWDGCGCGDPNCGQGGAFDSGWCGQPDAACGWLLPAGDWWWRNLSLWAGVHGFKGPFDQGLNGNFGFHEGLNVGLPLGLPWPIGVQIGLQGVHSNFKGQQVRMLEQDVTLRNADRNQVFFTAGLFRRAMLGGIQWGLAVDYLHDRYYDTADLTRLRSEIGYVFRGGHELGYWGAYGTTSQRVTADQIRLIEPTDMFAFYYRRYFQNGGEGRAWVGWTGHGDGLLGADVRLAIGGSWGLEGKANYLFSKHGGNMDGQTEEAWGISINLVYYPGRSADCVVTQVFRPLLGVADNALFTTNLRR